jgi:hypothetical protein
MEQRGWLTTSPFHQEVVTARRSSLDSMDRRSRPFSLISHRGRRMSGFTMKNSHMVGGFFSWHKQNFPLKIFFPYDALVQSDPTSSSMQKCYQSLIRWLMWRPPRPRRCLYFWYSPYSITEVCATPLTKSAAHQSQILVIQLFADWFPCVKPLYTVCILQVAAP